jgi:hypothetical protein
VQGQVTLWAKLSAGQAIGDGVVQKAALTKIKWFLNGAMRNS